MRAPLFILLLASTAVADSKVTVKTTDLYPSKACKTKIAAKNGSDPVLLCPSPLKGFQVEVGFSAIDTHVTVSGGGKETTFSGLVGKKLEWRIADNKPVALIVEIADHDDEKPGERIKPRVVVLRWGESKPQTEIPIASSQAAELAQAWEKARAAADLLAR